ncbi:hypothetical protein CEXT_757621 [Caerostris extrusa]|uniref:Uncharacterized protein n=1 Tax=Caerostris extrusa TaxID=172846 RepID=A0AAV4YCN2_CAEEX|nr:hypothetical protein CEXT_757621 [Caerostris extrusa]
MAEKLEIGNKKKKNGCEKSNRSDKYLHFLSCAKASEIKFGSSWLSRHVRGKGRLLVIAPKWNEHRECLPFHGFSTSSETLHDVSTGCLVKANDLSGVMSLPTIRIKCAGYNKMLEYLIAKYMSCDLFEVYLLLHLLSAYAILHFSDNIMILRHCSVTHMTFVSYQTAGSTIGRHSTSIKTILGMIPNTLLVHSLNFSSSLMKQIE